MPYHLGDFHKELIKGAQINAKTLNSEPCHFRNLYKGFEITYQEGASIRKLHKGALGRKVLYREDLKLPKI